MSYDVHIRRESDHGTLEFEHGGDSVSATCWWDPECKVDAGTYTGFATRMANKWDGRDGQKREAIWFGEDVPVNGHARTSRDIFIHKGSCPGDSDGCIVCDNDAVLAIWDAVEPKEAANVNIHVTDV